MHRTQLLLEDWQYESLKLRAERDGESISELVRKVLSAYLGDEASAAKKRLRSLRGLISDEDARGKDHDRFLYGKP